MKISKITVSSLLSPHRLTPSLIWLLKLLSLDPSKGPPIPVCFVTGVPYRVLVSILSMLITATSKCLA